MPCQFTGCASVVMHPSTVGWNVGQLCATHYTQLSLNFPALGHATAPVAVDMLKVRVLLQYNTALCMQCMTNLDTQMAAAAAAALGPGGGADPRFNGGGPNYLKLSRALEYFEGYCWFPANRAMLSGLLTTQGFNASLELGMNKDEGAVFEGNLRAHGDQSHRLQWHAIMAAATNNFTTPIYAGGGWSCSPLQLFYEFTQGIGQGIGAWGVVMDTQGNPGWGNPDNVMVSLRTSAGHQMIRSACQRRVNKYSGMALPGAGAAVHSAREQAINNEATNLLVAGTITAPPGTNPVSFLDQISALIYTWEKTSKPFVPAWAKPVTKAAERVYNNLRATAPHHLKPAPDHTYKEIKKNLLIKRDAPDKLVRIGAALVNQSKAAFNADYQYAAPTGAQPVNATRW